jgi:2-dehydropantoate 2-reductase
MAAWLDSTGRHEITLCARRPLGRLTVETPDRTFDLHPPVLTDPEQAGPVDWVLVATKAYDAEATAAWLAGLARDGAPVAVLQNGVEHRERFSPYLPVERIVPVVVECPAERDTPTRIRQRRRATLAVPDGPLGRAFADLFRGTEIDVFLERDFQTVVWKKLCFNAAGVISALLLEPAGVTRAEPIGEVVRQVAREAIAVGRAEGADLPDEWADGILERYRKSPPDSPTSIHADRRAGRPMEIDARNGVVVRLGRKHGIATPCNQMAVAMLEVMSRQKNRPV